MHTELIQNRPPSGMLSEAQFKHLVKDLPKPSVSNDTSPLHAGFLLGVQFVVNKLREQVK